MVSVYRMLMTRLPRPLLLLLSLLAWSMPASATRLEFVAQSGDTHVKGAEVCFVAAGAKTDRPNLYLGSDDVRCMSADDVIDVTPGKWAYFLRHRDGLVSMLPGTLTVPHGTAEFDFKQVICEMRSAATLNVAAARSRLRPGEILVLYIRHDGRESIPAAFPIPRNESSVLVPAELPLVVMAVRDGRVTNVSPPVVLHRQETRSIDLPPVTGAATVVAWVWVGESGQTPAPFWKTIRAPQATLTRDGKTVLPELLLGDGYGSDGGLLVFRGVAPGKWTLRVSGDTWQRDELPVEIGSAFVVASRSLVTTPVASVRLRWSAGASAPALDAACLPRGTNGPRTEPVIVRLYTCEGLKADADVETINPARCRMAPDVPVIDEKARVAVFTGLAEGTYLAEVREPNLPVAHRVVSAAIGEMQTADVELRSFDFFGRVTLDDAPLRARMEFRTGTVVSDESGRFEAHLTGDPGPSPVRIVKCQSEQTLATHIPAKRIERAQPYDIAVTTNTVHVQVLDATSRKPVEGAAVQAAAMMDKNSEAASFLAPVKPTDGNGESEVANVPTAFDLSVCADKDGYERQCGDRFSMKGERTKKVTVALQPLKNAGIVKAAQPVQFGRVFFVGDGHVTESADVAQDGTFHFKNDHVAPEYVVVTSANLPLFVTPLPLQAAAKLELIAPAAGRSISVSLSDARPQADALLGLVIDGRYIPSEALFNHQARRGDPMFILKRAPVTMPDIAGQSIAVMLGPSPYDIAPEDPDDIFTRPERRAATITKQVDSTGAIKFE